MMGTNQNDRAHAQNGDRSRGYSPYYLLMVGFIAVAVACPWLYFVILFTAQLAKGR